MYYPSNFAVFEDPERVAVAAADRFVKYAQAAIEDHVRFSVSLAGGNTPKRVYQLLASAQYRDRIDWSKIHVFFGDERSVPPDHPESNYRMACETLISHVSIPQANVHQIAGEEEPGISARHYEDDLRAFFPGIQWPRFDLVLLGMGEDGHTASLFPGTTAVAETKAWVVANWVEGLKTFRITLTPPAINHAAHIMFLVIGETKAQPLAEVVNDSRRVEHLPAQLIQPVNGSLEWLTDKAAVARLGLPNE